MISMINMYSEHQTRSDRCSLCSNPFNEIKSHPNCCEHFFHYQCLRNYVDVQLDQNQPIICPICRKIFHQIANRYKKSKEVLFQNVILSTDETQCCICFSRFKCPVASTDTCSHTFCFECLKKWCTFKHECPMDRMPIKLLLVADYPGGHITRNEEPPAIEQDLNGDGDNDEILNTTCELCHLGNNDDLLLLCDHCNRGYHIYCLRPSLTDIPEGDWFCQDCSNDMEVTNRRMARGIHRYERAIDDLENRYNRNLARNPTNRNRINRNRNRNRNRNLRNQRSDESDLDDEPVEPHRRQRPSTRTRTGALDSGDEGIRWSLRSRRINSDEDGAVSSGNNSRNNGPILRQGDNDIRESNSGLLISSRSRRRIIEESEEETEVERPGTREVDEVPNNTMSESDNDFLPTQNRTEIINETTLGGIREETRNRQGSVSSEPESEVEPVKRKVKIEESSDESGSSTKEEDEEEEEEEEEDEEEEESSVEHDSVTKLQVTTRKRAKDIAQDKDDDNPLPRSIKRPRLIDESSEHDSESNQPTVSNLRPKKKRKVIQSDSNDESSDETERKRHFSTSSSLSTIPCRLSSTRTNQNSNASESRNPTRLPRTPVCPKLKEIFSDSDNTDSDYDPSIERALRLSITSQQPSTSNSTSSQGKKLKTKRKSSKRKSKSTRKTPKKAKSTRKRKKTLKGRRSKTQASSSTSLNKIRDSITPKRLSLFGREKQLPVVSDEELNIKNVPRSDKSNLEINNGRRNTNSTPSTTIAAASSTSTSSTSILSEINEAQSNLCHISLSTISRLTDGRIVHKTRSEPSIGISSAPNENKDPKTHQSSTNPSSSSHSTDHRPVSRQVPVSVMNTTAIVTQSTDRKTDTQRQASSTVTFATTSNTTSTATPKASSSASSSGLKHINDIKEIIKTFLESYLEKGKINQEDCKKLSDRIAEKIMKRNNQRKLPGASSVRDFSKKYLEFYLKKRK